MLKKVCFVHCVDVEIAKTQMFGVHYMPVWVYVLAAYLRDIENLKIQMFDVRVQGFSDLPDSDLYLFTGINQDVPSILKFHKQAKEKYPHAKYVLGGPVCWSFSQADCLDRLNQFDHLVIGDGEPIIKDLVLKLVQNQPVEKILRWNTKFEVSLSKIMDRKLLDETAHFYYGAVIEVSRGCPFLCEFCDIRIQKDNNAPHNLNPTKIIEEIDYFARRGIKQILFACDNFIGDPKWAESVCDAIIEWREKTGLSVNIYTWLTINVSNFSQLLKKLRLAGFDMFFIGIESFEQNQLLETAKIQNVKNSLVESIQQIHSHGFIVVAGLIFGFDTEPDYVGNSTLDGILKSGLISGEPSLLTALPGTPLYKRMKYSGRLREGKLGLGGYKYQTNINYLKSRQQMIDNFQDFVSKYNKGLFQYKRFENFCSLIKKENLKSMSRGGYINVSFLFMLVVKNFFAVKHLIKRFTKLVLNFERLYYLFKAVVLVLRYQIQGINLWKYFNFWLFVWSNSVIKFETLQAQEFDIGEVGTDFDYNNLVPKAYLEDMSEPIPEHKKMTQRKFTSEALNKLVKKKA